MEIILVYIILTLVIVDVQARPCGKLSNIESCKCNDKYSSSVSHPSLCKLLSAYAISCSCSDGGEWNLPCGGYQNVQKCGPNKENGSVECLCADETIFVLTFGRRRGRGRGRGRGRLERGGYGDMTEYNGDVSNDKYDESWEVEGGYGAMTKYNGDASNDKDEESWEVEKLILDV